MEIYMFWMHNNTIKLSCSDAHTWYPITAGAKVTTMKIERDIRNNVFMMMKYNECYYTSYPKNSSAIVLQTHSLQRNNFIALQNKICCGQYCITVSFTLNTIISFPSHSCIAGREDIDIHVHTTTQILILERQC